MSIPHTYRQGAVYKGWVDSEEEEIHITVNGHPLRHVQYHSRELAWGYQGSGPAELSLSILAHYFRETLLSFKQYV